MELINYGLLDALRMIDIARKHGVSGVWISQRGAHCRSGVCIIFFDFFLNYRKSF